MRRTLSVGFGPIEHDFLSRNRAAAYTYDRREGGGADASEHCARRLNGGWLYAAELFPSDVAA